MMWLMNVLAQTPFGTHDPPSRMPPGPMFPLLIIVAVVVAILAAALWTRYRKKDD
jgi:hypothetical protein